MNTIKVDHIKDVPKDYTGIVKLVKTGTLWIKAGKYHREDGPAVEYLNGAKWWCINGKFHRTDGPAFINWDGRSEYWVNGKKTTKEAIELYEWIFPKKEID